MSIGQFYLSKIFLPIFLSNYLPSNLAFSCLLEKANPDSLALQTTDIPVLQSLNYKGIIVLFLLIFVMNNEQLLSNCQYEGKIYLYHHNELGV